MHGTGLARLIKRTLRYPVSDEPLTQIQVSPIWPRSPTSLHVCLSSKEAARCLRGPLEEVNRGGDRGHALTQISQWERHCLRLSWNVASSGLSWRSVSISLAASGVLVIPSHRTGDPSLCLTILGETLNKLWKEFFILMIYSLLNVLTYWMLDLLIIWPINRLTYWTFDLLNILFILKY